MADWYRTDAALFRHPKVAALDRALGQERTGWYVHGLWSWMTTYARDGVFDRALAEHLEHECGWRNEPGRLIAAMLAVGLLDERSNGRIAVHDWEDFQGAVVEKAEKDAARKRAQRARDRARTAAADVTRDRPRDVTRDGAGTRRDETDVTDGRDGTVTRPVAPGALDPVRPTDAPPGDQLWEWFQDQREADGHVREEPPKDLHDLDTLWRALSAKLGAEVDARARQAAKNYLAETKAKGAPWRWFATQWERYASKSYGAARVPVDDAERGTGPITAKERVL